MPVTKHFKCDMCKTEDEPYTYFTIESHAFKPDNRPTMDIYWYTQPKETFCSIECLAKAKEFFAKRYDKKLDKTTGGSV